MIDHNSKIKLILEKCNEKRKYYQIRKSKY